MKLSLLLNISDKDEQKYRCVSVFEGKDDTSIKWRYRFLELGYSDSYFIAADIPDDEEIVLRLQGMLISTVKLGECSEYVKSRLMSDKPSV